MRKCVPSPVGNRVPLKAKPLISPLILSWPRLPQVLAASKGRRAITQRRRAGVRSRTDSKVFTASGLTAGISDSLARPGLRKPWPRSNGLSVLTLDFRDRLGCAGALVCGAALKFVGDGRVEVAANRIGNLGNIFAAGFVPLLRPDGHLQNLALTVRIGAAFRKVFCRRFRLRALGSDVPRFFAVCHKYPRFK